MSEKLTLRYSREEMAFLRETTMSRTRPSNLSKDFDKCVSCERETQSKFAFSENGLFSPDKWLEYRWRCEGVENRVGGRRKPTGSRTSEVAASEDASVLSPQRRGFASGCRASSPKPTGTQHICVQHVRGTLQKAKDSPSLAGGAVVPQTEPTSNLLS